MPITRSAKKALRQSVRRAIQNQKRKEAYKDVLKRIRQHLAAKQLLEADGLVPDAYRALDKAAKTNVIHPRTASRLKSRLTTAIRRAKPTA